MNPPPGTTVLGTDGQGKPFTYYRDLPKTQRSVACNARPFVRASSFKGRKVEDLEWLVHERLLRSTVAILNGEGAAGKTTIALQLACAMARRAQDWLGAVIEHSGPAVFFTAEEPENECHRRLSFIANHHNFSFDHLHDLHLWCRPGEDCLLGVQERNKIIRPTPLFAEFSTMCCDVRAALIIIESAADVFGGNEMDRVEVRQFMTLLRGLAIKSGAGILLLQHPSLTGINSGTGTSGTLHWNNASRSRLYFEKPKSKGEIAEDANLRELIVKKSNYGPENERIRLKWQNGLFVPDTTLQVQLTAGQEAVQSAFLRCLDISFSQGRYVTHKRSAAYAPVVFEAMPEAGGISRHGFAGVMEYLFSTGRIVSESFGPASKHATRLRAVARVQPGNGANHDDET